MMDTIITALVAGALSIITAICGAAGIRAKKFYETKADTALKKRIVKECVAWAEQVYHACGGPEKKKRAADAIVERFEQAGLTYTVLELEHMIEAAVAAFNESFKKAK